MPIYLFVITGTQRSGTTLLFRKIDSTVGYYRYNEMWGLHDLLFLKTGWLWQKQNSAASYLSKTTL